MRDEMRSRPDDCMHSKVCLKFTSELEFTVPGHTVREYSAADDGIADICLNKKQNNDEAWEMFSMLMDLTDVLVLPHNNEVTFKWYLESLESRYPPFLVN